MRRLPVLAALVLASLIAASAWLAIVAQSDPEPLPTTEHFPRDDDQSQQQESQAQPGPEDEEAEQQSAEQESSEEEASEESQEEQETEPAEPIEPPPDSVDMLIEALDVPRPQVEPESAPEPTVVIEFETYVVEAGDTLADIARMLNIDLEDLITANELDSPDLLHIGQEIAIPIEVTVIEPVEEDAPSFEPVEIAPSKTENGIVYGTIRDYERGVINSAVIAMSQTDASVRLVEACIDGKRRTYIMGLQLPEGPTRIYWRFDDGSLNTDRWTSGDDLVESMTFCPFLHTLDEQEGIRNLWIRIGGEDLSFGVELLIPDDIRSNIAYCGS